MIAVASLDRLQRYINTPVTHTPHVPRCKPRHEKRRDNVMSTQSREAPTMLQHSTDPRYVQRLFGCQCQCVCVRAFAQVCVMSHAYWRSSLGIPQRKRAVCRRAPADDNSEEKCHENATFDTFNCNCITQVPAAIIREWKKGRGKNCWNTFTFWADRLLRLKKIDESANMHITFARTDYGQLAGPRIRLMSNTCAGSAGRNEGRGTWQCETALCSRTHMYIFTYIYFP